MKSRAEFLSQLNGSDVTHSERALALIWFYRETQQYEERSAAELAKDLREEGFAQINVSRLDDSLRRSRFLVRGRQAKTFQINLRRLTELDQRYENLLALKRVNVTENVIPTTWVAGTRSYLEQLVYQINGTYEYGFYDGCATLCRRLMEILIIEIYISQKRHQEIQTNSMFLPLEKLIAYIQNDRQIVLDRNNIRTMNEIKLLGDSAAHNRTYITRQEEIDEIKPKYCRMINELLLLSGIKK